MGKNLNILLVDDEPMIVKSVSRFLELQGHDVTVCTNGREAMDILPARTFDAAILDLDLPEFNGMEIARRISTTSSFTTIYITSGNPEPTDKLSCNGSESPVFVQKPFDLDDLLKHLESRSLGISTPVE